MVGLRRGAARLAPPPPRAGYPHGAKAQTQGEEEVAGHVKRIQESASSPRSGLGRPPTSEPATAQTNICRTTIALQTLATLLWEVAFWLEPACTTIDRTGRGTSN